MIGFGIALAVSLVAVGLLRWRVLTRGRVLIDVPNARSSHSTPTPRGGGLGLLIGIAIGLMAAWLPFMDVRVGAALGAVVLTALAGWLDDHGGLSVRIRLVAHMGAALLLLPLAHTFAPGWLAPLAVAWWGFWMISSINVVNFMDGIDGMIGLQSLVFGAFVAFSAAPGGMAQALGLATAGASLGFLVWNWSPAKIFLGDVGSGGLGALFVVLGALLVREGRVNFTAAFLPLAPIFLDASATLLRRARRGEQLSQAHRSHLYQRLANGGDGRLANGGDGGLSTGPTSRPDVGLGHARVSFGYAVASALCAAVALGRPAGGIPVTLAVLVALGLLGAACARYFLRPPANAYHS